LPFGKDSTKIQAMAFCLLLSFYSLYNLLLRSNITVPEDAAGFIISSNYTNLGYKNTVCLV
jgi:hypothetical protein